MKEFDLIEHYFNQHTRKRADVILGIGDDAALLKPPANHYMAVSTDSLIDSIHFMSAQIPPDDLGYRTLAVSLSDMAAMGAEPAWVMLSIQLAQVDPNWLALFSKGFFELIEAYQLQLVGGNMSSGPLSITTQITGFLPIGTGVKRSGAKIGDLIYVTGPLGDAGLALHLIKQNHPVTSDLLSSLYRPLPKVEAGLFLRSLASAMIDISDGLVADLKHILNQSKVGATLWIEKLPLSYSMKSHMGSLPEAYEFALSSGDDYELCFTIPPTQRSALEARLPNATCIGIIHSAQELNLTYQKKTFHLKKQGYQHFS